MDICMHGLIKEIIDTGKKIGSGQQSILWSFILNEKKYVLKHYHNFENNEGEILQSLKHENVVRCVDHGMFDGRKWVIMDFVDGQRLDSYRKLNEAQSQTLQNLIVWFESQGIVHREIRPAHIIVTPEEKLVLIDFGIASSPKYPLKSDLSNFKDINTPYGIDDKVAVEKIIKEFKK